MKLSLWLKWEVIALFSLLNSVSALAAVVPSWGCAIAVATEHNNPHLAKVLEDFPEWDPDVMRKFVWGPSTHADRHESAPMRILSGSTWNITLVRMPTTRQPQIHLYWNFAAQDLPHSIIPKIIELGQGKGNEGKATKRLPPLGEDVRFDLLQAYETQKGELCKWIDATWALFRETKPQNASPSVAAAEDDSGVPVAPVLSETSRGIVMALSGAVKQDIAAVRKFLSSGTLFDASRITDKGATVDFSLASAIHAGEVPQGNISSRILVIQRTGPEGGREYKILESAATRGLDARVLDAEALTVLNMIAGAYQEAAYQEAKAILSFLQSGTELSAGTLVQGEGESRLFLSYDASVSSGITLRRSGTEGAYVYALGR